MIHQVLNGDCLDVLRGMADNSVDSIVTDPPYGLSFMGKRWDYDVPSETIWAECLRVLKPGGHLLAFAGTRTQHRMAVRIEDAGFEIRDMLAWVYGSGFPKSHNGPWGGTALKPALEPITVARKPLTGTVAANVLEWSTGALNIDGCRVGIQESLPSYTVGKKQGAGQGLNPRFTRQNQQARADSGENPRYDPSGRWPANLVHDGSEEVVALFPQSNSSPPSANGRYGEGRGQGADGVSIFTTGFNSSTPNRAPIGDTGSAARFFYCAKASRSERDAGLDDSTAAMRNDGRQTDIDNPYQRGKVLRNPHPTVKPVALMRWLCRLVTPPGGVVLDPFAGSGSTGVAAVAEGFSSILIERDTEYVEIIRRRLSHAQGVLFSRNDD